MTGTLLVTPSELKAAASSFQDKGNQVRTLTQNMTSKVAELTGRVAMQHRNILLSSMDFRTILIGW